MPHAEDYFLEKEVCHRPGCGSHSAVVDTNLHLGSKIARQIDFYDSDGALIDNPNLINSRECLCAPEQEKS